MADDIVFTEDVLDRVIQRQHGQCGCCGDRLESEYSGAPLIPAASVLNDAVGLAYLNSDDNCVVVCEDCRGHISEMSEKTGSVPPPEFYTFSHGNDVAKHEEWSGRANNQWNEIAAQHQSLLTNRTPTDPTVVPDVQRPGKSADEMDPTREHRQRQRGEELEQMFEIHQQSKREWLAETQKMGPSDLQFTPPQAHGETSGLIFAALVAQAAKNAVTVWKGKLEAWGLLDQKKDAADRAAEAEAKPAVKVANVVADDHTSPPVATSREPIYSELPTQTIESPAQNVESRLPVHLGPEEDASRIQRTLDQEHGAESARNTAQQSPRDTWKSLDDDIAFAPNFSSKPSISDESRPRYSDLPTEKVLRPWTEEDSASVKWILSEVRDDESAAHAVTALKELASQVDFRPETNGYHVMYARETNHRIANDFTQAVQGFKTLDQTRAGQAMNEIYQIDQFTREQRKEISGALSDRFVRDARGTLVVFDAGYPTYTDYPENSKYRKLGQSQLDANFEQQSLAHNVEFPALGENSSIDRVAFNPPRETWKSFENEVGFLPRPGGGSGGGGAPQPTPTTTGSSVSEKTQVSPVLLPHPSRRSATKAGDEARGVTWDRAAEAIAKPEAKGANVATDDHTSPLASTSPEQISNELPAQTISSPAQNVKSPAELPRHAEAGGDVGGVKRTLGQEHDAQGGREIPNQILPRETWKGLAKEIRDAQILGDTASISNDSRPRYVGFPTAKTVRQWTEENTATVDRMLSHVRDKESAAHTVKALKELASQVDFLPETNGYHVSYAGSKNRQIALQFTREVRGFKTLDETAAGQAMCKIHQIKHFTPEQLKEVADALSERFVSDARGPFVIFDKGYPRYSEYPENSKERKPGQSQLEANFQQQPALYTVDFPALGQNLSHDRLVVNPEGGSELEAHNRINPGSPGVGGGGGGGIVPPGGGGSGGGPPPGGGGGGGGGSPAVTRRSSVLVPNPSRLSVKRSSDDSVARTAPSAPRTPALESPKSGVPAKSISVGDRHEAVQQTSEPGLSPQQKSASTPQQEVAAPKVEATRQAAPEFRAPATGPAQTIPAVPRMEAPKAQVHAPEASASKHVATPAPKVEAGRQAAPEIRAAEPSASQKAATAPKVEAPKAQVRAPETSAPKQVAIPGPKVESGRQAAPEIRAAEPSASQKATTAPKVEAPKAQVRAPETSAPKQVAAPAPKVEAGRQTAPEVRAPALTPSPKAATANKVEAPKAQVRAPEASASKQVAAPAAKVEAGRQAQPEVRAPAPSASQKAATAPKLDAPKAQVRAPETSAPKQVAAPAPKVEAGRQAQPEVRAPAPSASQKAATAPKVEARKSQARAPEASVPKQVAPPAQKAEGGRQAAPEARAPAPTPSQKATIAPKVEAPKAQVRTPETSAPKQVATPALKVQAGRQAQPAARAPAPSRSQNATTAPKVEAPKTHARATDTPVPKQVITPAPKVAAGRQAAPKASAPAVGPSQKTTAAPKIEGGKPQVRTPEASASKQTAPPGPKAEAGRQTAGQAVQAANKKAPESSASSAPKKDTAQQKPAIAAQTKAPSATQSTSNAPAKSQARPGPAPAPNQKVATPTPAKTPVAKRPVVNSVPTPAPRPVQPAVRQPSPPRIQAPAPERPAPSIPAPKPSLPAVRPSPPAPSVRPSGNGKGMG